MLRYFLTGKIKSIEDLKKKIIGEIKLLSKLAVIILVVVLIGSIFNKDDNSMKKGVLSDDDIYKIVSTSYINNVKIEDIVNNHLTNPEWLIKEDSYNRTILYAQGEGTMLVTDSRGLMTIEFNILDLESGEFEFFDITHNGMSIGVDSSKIYIEYLAASTLDNTLEFDVNSFLLRDKVAVLNISKDKLDNNNGTNRLESNGDISDIYGEWEESVYGSSLIIYEDMYNSYSYDVVDEQIDEYTLLVHTEEGDGYVKIEYDDDGLYVSYCDQLNGDYYGHQSYNRVG